MTPGSPLITVENLSKTYRSGAGQLTVFSGLNLAVQRGERLALIGESGTGKSTLLHLIGGLDRPTSGRILFEDQSISDYSEAQLARFRNRSVGFVWQIHHLLPEFTAAENAMMPLLVRGGDQRHIRSEAQAALASVGLAGRENHRAGELSGGERQRVVLARALVTKPKLLLLDEPTGNLDQRTGHAIFSVVEELHVEYDLTSVLVTHNPEFSARCDRALRLQNGVLVNDTQA